MPETLLFGQTLEEARASFPEVVEEYERLREWVATCIGTHIADPGGQSVN